MEGLRTNIANSETIYAVALVVSDDFDSIMIYANTEAHFATTDGEMLDKWYFAQWSFGGVAIDTAVLSDHFGEVEDWDETPETGNASLWLATMTEAMHVAQRKGAFLQNGTEATIFCSMVDSGNAVWLEELSSQFLNPPSRYKEIASELTNSANEWYGEDVVGRAEFKTSYESLLSELKTTK